MRKSREPLSPRLVALLILPCFLGACTSWQPLRMSNLRVTMREYQPDRIQLILQTESFGEEIVLSNPQLWGDAPMDTIRGILGGVGQVGVPFSDVVGANFPDHDETKTVFLVAGSLLLGLLIACSSSECLTDPF